MDLTIGWLECALLHDIKMSFPKPWSYGETLSPFLHLEIYLLKKGWIRKGVNPTHLIHFLHLTLTDNYAGIPTIASVNVDYSTIQPRIEVQEIHEHQLISPGGILRAMDL